MIGRCLIATVLLTMIAAPAGAQDKVPPYWASIASGEAMMRSGPGRNYPGQWLYKRRDLPIRVVKTYPNWRLVEDSEGTRGWMLVSLLSDQRTAIVRPGKPRPIHVKPSSASRIAYLAEAGVVGRVEHCTSGWCELAIGKKRGFVRIGDIWGVSPDETVD